MGATGVTLLDADEASLVPTLFVAVTVNVYAVPLLRPVTLSGELAPVAVRPPGLAVTVYELILAPPLLAGKLNATNALASPPVAVTPSGELGLTTN